MSSALRLGTKTEVLGTLRSIIRICRKNGHDDVTTNATWVQPLMDMYRENQMLTDKKEIMHARNRATDYLNLLEAIDEQTYLRELEAGVEQKLSTSDIVRRSAHRVGLKLPGQEEASAPATN